jgi:hypothetical protein
MYSSISSKTNTVKEKEKTEKERELESFLWKLRRGKRRANREICHEPALATRVNQGVEPWVSV